MVLRRAWNVSVCAAIIMYSVTQRLRRSDIAWHLSEARRDQVLFQWYRNAIKASDEILKRLTRFNGRKIVGRNLFLGI